MNDLVAIARSGQLPQAYLAAQRALAHCSQMDECYEWADKAAALASYAKQVGDETLHRYADRIKARAVRRCGEVAKQIEPAHGANQNIGDGDRTKVGRLAAAEAAGLSRHQVVQAIRVANVPDAEFEPRHAAAELTLNQPPTHTRDT